MTLASILLFLLLLSASTVSVVTLWSVVRAHNKRRMLGEAHGRSCETLDCIGVSVLGSEVYDPAQVENLLAVEYSRYEAIIVLDSQRRPSEFEALVARYRMISVDYIHSGEFPSDGVRALYRSRKRGFRRLVIVDRAQDTPAGDLDVAAGVAAYDYLLPVGDGQILMPDAVERLVIEVGERPAGTLDAIRTCVGEPAFLFRRDRVAAVGGFERCSVPILPGRRTLLIWEPLFRRERQPWASAHALRIAAAVLLSGGVGAAVCVGYWIAAAALLTVALAWSCAGYAAQLLGERGGPPERLYSGWRTEGYKKFHNS